MNGYNKKYELVYFSDEVEAFKSIYSYGCFYTDKTKLTKSEMCAFIKMIWFDDAIEQIKPFVNIQTKRKLEDFEKKEFKCSLKKEKKARK